jgi:hypothetical protein
MRIPVPFLRLLIGLGFLVFFCVPPLQAAEPETHQFAVTLLSSFDPIPESMVPRDIEGKVYRTQATVFGRTIYFVRTGFYATAGEAAVVKERLTARFPAAHVAEITPDEYLRITGGKPRTAPAPKPPAVVAQPPPAPMPPPPPVAAPEPAPAPVAAPVAAAPAAPPATTAPALTGNVEQDAVLLLDQARAAITRGDYSAAISLLEQILRLPPNKQTQEAQELMGLAQERNKDIPAARREYTFYLQQYPEGPGAERVRQRLAAIEAPVTPPPLKKVASQRQTGFTVNGNFSQFYYYGQSQVDSTTTVLGPATPFTGTDQSSLISSLDLRGRYRGDVWDHRVVIRDTYNLSFLDDVDSTNRLYSAYYELTNKVSDYSGRIGRQPGTSGGVLGRFDGVLLGVNLLPKWRVNLVAGEPVDFYEVNYAKQFWGLSLDYGLFANHWNGSVYILQQTVDGLADREAIGGDLRFFSPKGSALLYLDYDTLYRELNIATFQATWLTSPSTTWNTLLDQRHAPTLMTSNALFNQPVGTTLNSLLTTMTETQARQLALDNSPVFKTAMLGVAHNLNTTWQIGGDVKFYELSAIPTSPTVTTILGTGATTMVTLQTIANGLFRKRDLSVLSLSFLDGDTYSGQVAAFTHRMLLGDRWVLDLGLSYYQQSGEPVETVIDPGTGPETHLVTTDTSRLTPMLRLGYRWGQRVTLEAEAGLEISTTSTLDRNITAPATTRADSDSDRSYFVLGYRWDF